MKILDLIRDSFYPRRCACCKEFILDGYFCQDCADKILLVNEPICISCGNNVKNCQCDTYIFHFDGIVAPLVNEGITRQAFYKFKFKKDYFLLPFLTEKMSSLIRKHYCDVEFDVMTFIPKNKKEYNQCRVLAEDLSKKLNIKLDETALIKLKPNKTQHDLMLNERFDNVKGVYKSPKNLKGKTVLLLDDIKTTGATLNECARELKFAGAEKVYCITALIT